MCLIDKAVKEALKKNNLKIKFNTDRITRQPNTRFAMSKRNKGSKFKKDSIKKEEF